MAVGYRHSTTSAVRNERTSFLDPAGSVKLEEHKGIKVDLMPLRRLSYPTERQSYFLTIGTKMRCSSGWKKKPLLADILTLPALSTA